MEDRAGDSSRLVNLDLPNFYTRGTMGEVVGIESGSRKAAPVPEPQIRTAGDVIRDCNDAASKMGNGNPHKNLVLEAAWTIHSLVQRLQKYDAGKGDIDMGKAGPVTAEVPSGQ